jgi:hypothetical protein
MTTNWRVIDMSPRTCRSNQHILCYTNETAMTKIYTRRYGVVVAASLCLLGGCATAPPETKISVVADSFCLAAKKRSWSVDDTAGSIDEANRVNGGIDRACGKGKPIS